jgi:RHS repeat-associated protein
VRSGVEVSAKRYRYTGKERDEETGLYYHGARYYAAWLGRWASPDPSGLVDGPNIYEYAGCNPINIVDPTGREGEFMRFVQGAIDRAADTVADRIPGFRLYKAYDQKGFEGVSVEALNTLSPARRTVENIAEAYKKEGAGGAVKAGVRALPLVGDAVAVVTGTYEGIQAASVGKYEEAGAHWMDVVAGGVSIYAAAKAGGSGKASSERTIPAPEPAAAEATKPAAAPAPTAVPKPAATQAPKPAPAAAPVPKSIPATPSPTTTAGAVPPESAPGALSPKTAAPPKSAPAAPSGTTAHPPGSTAAATPNMKGVIGDERSVVKVDLEGGILIGRQVTLEILGKRIRIDLLWIGPQGGLFGTEVKLGPKARYTPGQRELIPKVNSGVPAIPRGANAKEAGLGVGKPVNLHIFTDRWQF